MEELLELINDVLNEADGEYSVEEDANNSFWLVKDDEQIANIWINDGGKWTIDEISEGLDLEIVGLIYKTIENYDED